MIKPVLLAAAALLLPTAASAKWHEASSPHFVVYANEDPGRLKAFATRLERFDKAMRYIGNVPDAEAGDTNRLNVFVVSDIGAVQRLAGSGSRNIAGFYIGRASGSVAFVPRRTGSGRKTDLDADTIFFHEYAHHFALGNFSGPRPAWLIEGEAEFFSTATVEKDGGVGIGRAAAHRAYGAHNLGQLPLSKMLSGETARLSPQQTESLYGRGWLLAHYLTFKTARRGQLGVYLRLLEAGTSGAQAATTAFGDLKVLDKELGAYISQRHLNYLPIPAAVLPIGAVTVRPLRPGEEAFIPIRMRSIRGVDAKAAAALVPPARRAAAPYPNDPTVQAQLAEVEYDAGNFAEAEAAADRALAADRRHVDALVYKGRIEMAQAVAAKSTDKAVWRDARRWFIKASNADTEAAEPKVLFHASFGAAKAQPTSNAVEALIYAQQLVPQDNGLRMQVVRQHLQDGKAAGARRVLGPIAFNPHAGAAWRDWAGKVMAKLAQNDAKGALALWNERNNSATAAN